MSQNGKDVSTLTSRKLENTTHHLFVCQGKSCKKEGAKAVYKAIQKRVDQRELKKTVQVTKTKCLEQCKGKCIAVDYPEGTWYRNLTPSDADDLLDSMMASDVNKNLAGHILKNGTFKKVK